ncbi:HDIG domain-containing protein [Desulfallas sp. Bu1-1]|uniref:HDIG domain-containing metalloprotein n=1 Tax=Desulfallas sp. Bu1-1 TaxID=2787620 RepID=UPI00189FCC8D|nr:HDIG domain-containing metalloprotein [Desulfallas sp. Bu1-1]MBF7084681.1 HDIG domain-containing protein [Desulfallas sp. Bu1-1]
MNKVLVQLDQLVRNQGRKAWLVGGFVRDLLLGRPSQDVDVVVSGSGMELARELAELTGSTFVPLDSKNDVCRVVFKTGFRMVQLDITGLGEVSLLADLHRRDFTINAMALPLGVYLACAPGVSKQGVAETNTNVVDCPVGATVFAGTGLAPDMLVDPLGGLADLRSGIIRACSPRSIAGDPLRALRAARFAGQFGWRIEADTVRFIRGASLDTVAWERVQEELVHILMLPCAHEVIQMLDVELGILEQLFPEILPMRQTEQNGHHVDNVWVHCLKTLQCCEVLLASFSTDETIVSGGLFAPVAGGRRCTEKNNGFYGEYPDGNQRDAGTGRPGSFSEGPAFYGMAGEPPFPTPGVSTLPPAAAGPLAVYLNSPITRARSRLPVLKLACLFHDVGKPATRAVAVDGRFTFYGHHTAGAPLAAAIARRLRLSRWEEDLLATLVRGHMDPLFLYKSRPVSGRAAYRFFRRLGEDVPGCLLLSMADISSSRLAAGAAREAAAYRDFIAGMLERYFKDPAVSGRSRPLMSGREICRLLNIQPSPLVGRLLEELAAARAAGEVRTRREAVEWVKKRHLRETR